MRKKFDWYEKHRMDLPWRWCFCAARVVKRHGDKTFSAIYDELHSNLVDYICTKVTERWPLTYIRQAHGGQRRRQTCPRISRKTCSLYKTLLKAIKISHPFYFAQSIDEMAHVLTEGEYQRVELFTLPDHHMNHYHERITNEVPK